MNFPRDSAAKDKYVEWYLQWVHFFNTLPVEHYLPLFWAIKQEKLILV
jgi:hypothetical protein